MDCPSCQNRYNLKVHRPKNLPCGHTICKWCVTHLSTGGELTCPICQRVTSLQKDTEFPDCFAILPNIEETLVMCSQHCDMESVYFCPTHLVALCEQCVHECKLVDMDEQVKHLLIRELEGYDVQQMPQTLRAKVEQKFRLSLRDLISTAVSIRASENSLSCIMCQAHTFGFVNLSELSLYCSACYEAAVIKNLDVQQYFVPFSEECRQYIYSAVFSHLRNIDFCYLEHAHYIWLFSPPANFDEFFREGKEIVKLENNPRLNEKKLPAYFLCPHCKTLAYKQEHQFRRLPCNKAFHAICETCALSFSSTGVIQCPLDQQTFQMSPRDLPKFEQVETCCPDSFEESKREDYKQEEPVQPVPHCPPVPYGIPPPTPPQKPVPARVRIGQHLPLADVGILIPQFQQERGMPTAVPRLAFQAVDRFLRVLPSDVQVQSQNEEDRSFMDPWYVNFFVEQTQVEVLTFRPYFDVSLWGVGIANPIAKGATAIVEWVRLYKDDKAIGHDYKEMQLASQVLIGGNSVLTDIYFLEPYQIPTLTTVTMKVKLGRPSSDPQDRLPIYHGNHIGRYEDIVGTDGVGWEAFQTFCVEDSERNSGQQHFIGPLLRLIYQSAL